MTRRKEPKSREPVPKMGFKSRLNYPCGVCFKGDCIYNGENEKGFFECKSPEYCIRFDMYRTKEQKGGQDETKEGKTSQESI